MKNVEDRYAEAARSYFQAAAKLWASDDGREPDHLIAPTLQCLAYALEIAFKCRLFRCGKTPEDARSFGHDLMKMWKTPELEPLRTQAGQICERATYPADWTYQPDDKKCEFLKQLTWLSEIHSHQDVFENGNKISDVSLRYPVPSPINVYPPNFLLAVSEELIDLAIGDVP